MAGTDGSAINAYPTRVVEYGVDPRGARLVAGLTGVLGRVLRGSEGTVVTRRSPEWNGYAAPPQQYTGMAPLGVGTVVTGRVSDLSDERAGGIMDNTALRIFAARLARGRS